MSKITKNKNKKSLINIFLTKMKNQKVNLNQLHIPVLLNELVNSIGINKYKQNIIVDCTLGMAGHGKEIIKKLNIGDIFIGFDVDERNFSIIKPILEEEFKGSGIELILINDNFVNLKSRLDELGIKKITGIYYDLGLSSLHLDNAERGFSFKLNGPLDMRFDRNNGIPASQILNSYKESDLVKIFKEYGEDFNSKKIASQILIERKKGFKFRTTKDLSDLIGKISRDSKSKNRIFQALRIKVNKELEVIEKSVLDAIDILEEGGSIFIISFHSLEDRIVKNIFKKESMDCICRGIICVCKHKKRLKILNKKPLLPSNDESKNNSRSRSAKARFAMKI